MHPSSLRTVSLTYVFIGWYNEPMLSNYVELLHADTCRDLVVGIAQACLVGQGGYSTTSQV